MDERFNDPLVPLLALPSMLIEFSCPPPSSSSFTLPPLYLISSIFSPVSCLSFCVLSPLSYISSLSCLLSPVSPLSLVSSLSCLLSLFSSLFSPLSFVSSFLSPSLLPVVLLRSNLQRCDGFRRLWVGCDGRDPVLPVSPSVIRISGCCSLMDGDLINGD